MAKTTARTTRPSSPPKRKQTPTSEAAAPAAPTASAARADASTPRSATTLDGATMSGTGATDLAARPTPSHDQIAARAYQLYVTRGGGEGEAMNDWLRAEGELRS